MRILLCLFMACALTANAQDEPWQADYRRACELAKQSRTADALGALEAACTAGLRDMQKILLEPALNGLHGERQFRILIRSYSATGPLTLAAPDEPGQRLIVRGRLVQPDGKPAGAAIIYAFHADDDGKYTKTDAMDEPRSRLFGYLRADDTGRFELRTIMPGAYPERTDVEGPERFIPRHIHLEITSWTGATTKVQLVFDDDPRLSHPHWKEWAAKAGHPIAKVTQQANGRAVAEFGLRLQG